MTDVRVGDSRHGRTIALVLLSAAPSVAEATAVAAIGFQAARGLAGQASAFGPYKSYMTCAGC